MADFGALLSGLGIGGVIGQAIVKLELDSAKYQAELKAANASTAASTSSMGNTLAAFGGAAKAGMAAGAIAIGAFVVNGIRAASDLGEAVNKNNVVFAGNAAEVEKWAEGGADAFGLSKTAALDAAGGFGQMLQTAGLAVDESANMSKALVQLGGDMASFNNIDPTEALEKLRSGLAGEAEPLRRFGVFLSEAAVKAKAYETGIADVGAELTEAQKVQARYAIILEQTTKQQGDFQRTADSVPNTIRSMRAEFENVSAEVGTALLPVVADLLSLVKDLVPALKLLAEGLKAVVEVASDLISALTLQGNEFDTLSGSMQKWGEQVRNGSMSLTEFDQKMRALAEETELTFDRSEEYIAALQRLREEEEHAAFGADRLAHDVRRGGAAMEYVGEVSEDTGKQIRGFANMTGEELRDWRTSTRQSFRDVVISFDKLSTAGETTTEDLLEGFQQMRENAGDFRRAMRELGQKSNEWIPERFREYLSTLGPAEIIAFAEGNRRAKNRMVEDWTVASGRFKDTLGSSFIDLSKSLDDLDNKTTNHKVRVTYEYRGFDPSKPGMGGPQ